MRVYSRKRPEFIALENVEELCRLCLEKAVAPVTIYDDNHSDKFYSPLALRIMSCLGFEVSNDKTLPNIMCSQCHTELEKYYTFRKKCELSYMKLKSHVEALKLKNNINDKVEDEIVLENRTDDVPLQDIPDDSVQQNKQDVMFKVNFNGSIDLNDGSGFVGPIVTITRADVFNGHSTQDQSEKDNLVLNDVLGV